MEELFNEFVNEHLFKLSVGVGGVDRDGYRLCFRS